MPGSDGRQESLRAIHATRLSTTERASIDVSGTKTRPRGEPDDDEPGAERPCVHAAGGALGGGEPSAGAQRTAAFDAIAPADIFPGRVACLPDLRPVLVLRVAFFRRPAFVRAALVRAVFFLPAPPGRAV